MRWRRCCGHARSSWSSRPLALGLAVIVGAVALGVPLAWLTVRTDLPARRRPGRCWPSRRWRCPPTCWPSPSSAPSRPRLGRGWLGRWAAAPQHLRFLGCGPRAQPGHHALRRHRHARGADAARPGHRRGGPIARAWSVGGSADRDRAGAACRRSAPEPCSPASTPSPTSGPSRSCATTRSRPPSTRSTASRSTAPARPVLALLLLALALLLVWAEGRVRRRAALATPHGRRRVPTPVRLGRWRWPACSSARRWRHSRWASRVVTIAHLARSTAWLAGLAARVRPRGAA